MRDDDEEPCVDMPPQANSMHQKVRTTGQAVSVTRNAKRGMSRRVTFSDGDFVILRWPLPVGDMYSHRRVTSGMSCFVIAR